MSIVQLNPWQSLGGVSEQLHALLHDSLSNKQDRNRWRPALDIIESEDAYTISLDVPGVPSENIEITLEDELLKIKGSRTIERVTNESDHGYRSIERVTGEFQRAVRLPPQANRDSVTAVSKDGVLTITVKKAEELLPKRIEVRS